MLTDEFKREERYIIIKLKDLKYASAENHLHRILREGNIPTRSGLVIESDWPEYEPTWKAIEARMTGRAIEAEVRAEAQEPVAFPSLPAGIAAHPNLGELYDRLQMQQYAMRYAMLHATPQPPAPCPKCEERAKLLTPKRNWFGVPKSLEFALAESTEHLLKMTDERDALQAMVAKLLADHKAKS